MYGGAACESGSAFVVKAEQNLFASCGSALARRSFCISLKSLRGNHLKTLKSEFPEGKSILQGCKIEIPEGKVILQGCKAKFRRGDSQKRFLYRFPSRKIIFAACWPFPFEEIALKRSEMEFPQGKVIFEALKIKILGGKVIFEALEIEIRGGKSIFKALKIDFPTRKVIFEAL